MLGQSERSGDPEGAKKYFSHHEGLEGLKAKIKARFTTKGTKILKG